MLKGTKLLLGSSNFLLRSSQALRLSPVVLTSSSKLQLSTAFPVIMANGINANSELEKMKARAEMTEKILADLQAKIKAVKQAAVKEAGLQEEEKLRQENADFRAEIAKVKKALTLAEIANGVRQVCMPNKAAIAVFTSKTENSAPPQKSLSSAPQVNGEGPTPAGPSKGDDGAGGKKAKQADKSEAGGKKAKTEKGSKGEAGETKSKKGAASSASAGGAGDNADAPVDISRLDMRVGKIVGVDKHPDADSLYVEQVDLGEGRNRTIVSGLVKHVPITAMKDRIAVFMCNLKPAKMRGVTSEGMIMCASGSDKVEILVPPADAAIGDKVTVVEYPGTPDAQLNPKKKIWETLKPDVRTNADRVATYKGAVFHIEGKGVVVAPTLSDAQIS